jgi:LacI family transcriptional regulator
MKDVAALAAVAIKTVSRVMNGDQTVAPDLAARIRDAASKLGYRPNQHALDKAGLQADPLIVRHDLRTIDAAAQAATELICLPDPPTALFASQNLVTIGTVKALSRAGRQQRIALVGFDDFVLADALVPGVTVITQDTTRLGRLAAQLLFARLDGDDSPARTHVVPTGMVMRGSGEIRPPATTRAASR